MTLGGSQLIQQVKTVNAGVCDMFEAFGNQINNVLEYFRLVDIIRSV